MRDVTPTVRLGAPGDDLVGTKIGGYAIRERIGAGGMGAVYVAVHPTLDRRVAVKVIKPEMSQDLDLRTRFFDEARAAAKLRSPHIVEVHDLASLPDGRCYMVMELLEGESLASRLRRERRLPAATAIELVRQALDGLAVAHSCGIVHRDIKPENLFLASDEQLKILDFGLAKLGSAPPGAGLTGIGTILGTPGYMAPEQASGHDAVDGRADLYAIGVVLYELVAGRRPFEADDWVDLVALQRTARVPPSDDIEPAVFAVIERALAKDPHARFADATSMRAALDKLAPADARPRSRAPWLLAAAAVVSGVGVMWVMSRPNATSATAPRDAATRVVAPTIAAPPDAAVTMAVVQDATSAVLVPDATSPARTAGRPPKKPAWISRPLPRDAAHLDVHGHGDEATRLARRIYADAVLIALHASGLAEDGTVDVSRGGSVTYWFASASHSARGDVPSGIAIPCEVMVKVGAEATDHIAIGPVDDESCDAPAFAPRCTPREIWRKAMASGAPTGWVADLESRWIATEHRFEWGLSLKRAHDNLYRVADDCR